jgi:hypothetical protein
MIKENIKKFNKIKAQDDELNENSIFHMIGIFAVEFVDWANEYENNYNYAPGDKEPLMAIMTFYGKYSFPSNPGVFDKSKLVHILKDAESGEAAKVALAKIVLLEMENVDWNWQEAWVHSEGLGFKVDENRWNLTPKQMQVRDLVNNTGLSFAEMLAEYGI